MSKQLLPSNLLLENSTGGLSKRKYLINHLVPNQPQEIIASVQHSSTFIPMFKVASIEVVALVLRILWTDPLVNCTGTYRNFLPNIWHDSLLTNSTFHWEEQEFKS